MPREEERGRVGERGEVREGSLLVLLVKEVEANETRGKEEKKKKAGKRQDRETRLTTEMQRKGRGREREREGGGKKIYGVPPETSFLE